MNDTRQQTDYASMTDEQLNREVAERLGWTDFKEDQYFLESWGNYDFVDCTFGTPPNGKSQPIDDVANDNNAAAALDFGEYAVVIIERRRGYNWVEVQGMEIGAFHDNLARAISVCWLMYKDAQS